MADQTPVDILRQLPVGTPVVLTLPSDSLESDEPVTRVALLSRSALNSYRALRLAVHWRCHIQLIEDHWSEVLAVQVLPGPEQLAAVRDLAAVADAELAEEERREEERPGTCIEQPRTHTASDVLVIRSEALATVLALLGATS